MSWEAIARRYARALFDIGKETGTLTSLSAEIASFAETYDKSEELRDILSNPLVAEGQREAVLREIGDNLGLFETSQNTLRLLLRKHRLPALPEISRQLARLVDEDGGVLRANVTSAAPLPESYLLRLRTEIERATGSKVVVSHRVDPSLIAGVVTRIGDRVVDGSLRARLGRFREALLAT